MATLLEKGLCLSAAISPTATGQGFRSPTAVHAGAFNWPDLDRSIVCRLPQLLCVHVYNAMLCHEDGIHCTRLHRPAFTFFNSLLQSSTSFMGPWPWGRSQWRHSQRSMAGGGVDSGAGPVGRWTVYCS